MMQNGRINSPKLRPRLSSSEKPITINMSSCLEVEVSIKIKFGHEGIMIILHNSNIYRFCHMITYVQVMIFSQSQSMNQKPY